MMGTANAESSVSLYGELDAGLGWLNNVGGRSQFKAVSGLIDGSFVGLKGSNDFSSGTQVVFQIERGISVMSGNSVNDHPLYFGIARESIGTVTLGYQYDSIHDYLAPLTLTGGTGGTAFAHPFDNDNANNSLLAHNAIKYEKQLTSDWKIGGFYAFSNVAGDFSNNRAYGIGASYQNGSLSAGAAWLHVSGAGNSDAGAYDATPLPALRHEIVDSSVQTQNRYGIGVNYLFGDITLGAVWTRSTFVGIADLKTGSKMPSIGFSNYEVNANFQLTPSLSVASSYTYTKSSNGHWHAGGLQAVRLISKRTDVYSEVIYQHASADARALIAGFDPSTSRTQLLVGAGFRHRF
ncbi:porin [Caballeronia sp. HLA56]